MKHRHSPAPRRDQAGEGWVGTLLWALFAVVVIVVGIKMLKPKYNEYVLESKLEEIVRLQGAPDAGRLTKEVMDMAARERLPIQEENITVTKTGSATVLKVIMDQPVDLFVTKYTVHAEIEKQSNAF